MRPFVLALLFAGCAADVCDGFESCLALTVEPAGAQLVIDALQVDSSELEIADKSSTPKKPIALPVRLAVVAPTGWQGGSFNLRVRGLRNQMSLGEDRLSGMLPRGAHVSITAFLGPDAPDRDEGEVVPRDAAVNDDEASSADLQPPAGIFPANRGLDGVTARAVAADPKNPDIVYVAAQSEGLFQSSDGGKTWHTANRGIEGEDIFHIAIAPSSTSTLYAASKKLFKSTDSGASWTAILAGNVSGIAVDPADADKVFVTLGDDQMKTPGGVLLSIDGGKNFSHIEVGLGATDVTTLAMDPTNSNVLWCGGQMLSDAFTGRFLARSDNGGSSWTRVTATNLTLHVSSPFHIAIDPKTPTTLFVTQGATILRSTDNGANFDFFFGGITTQQSLAQGVSDAEFAPDGTLYVATGLGLFRLPESAASFTSLSTDSIALVAVSASRPQRLYLHENGTMFVSDDSGGSFQEGISGLGNAPVMLVQAAGSVLLAASNTGLYRSNDGAATWKLVDHGLVRTVALSPDGSVAWAAVNGVLRHSTDGGASFTTVNTTSLPETVTQLVIDPTDSNRVYVVGESISSGALKITFLRSDDGASFVDLSAAFPSTNIPLVADPKDSTVLWDGPTFKTANRGTSWTAETPMFTPPSKSSVGHLVIDPANPLSMYLADALQIYHSSDGGSTWSASRTGLGDTDEPFIVAIGPAGRVYLMTFGTNNSSLLYRSDDGITWRFLDQIPASITSIAVDSVDPDTFYLSTLGGPGLWKSVTGG